jgi:hypothetical protein
MAVSVPTYLWRSADDIGRRNIYSLNWLKGVIAG